MATVILGCDPHKYGVEEETVSWSADGSGAALFVDGNEMTEVREAFNVGKPLLFDLQAEHPVECRVYSMKRVLPDNYARIEVMLVGSTL